jgi:hypothetical protein
LCDKQLKRNEQIQVDCAMTRYALYFAPAIENPWWQAGSQWLGRCAATGTFQQQPEIDEIPKAQFAALTANPRRYGFHATLKAPFRLAAHCTIDELKVALNEIAESQQRFVLPRMHVTQIDDFLALAPLHRSVDADRVAKWCMTKFDCFRAPLTEHELTRRRNSPLTDGENALLEQWGYPYVLDRFRFHFSLSGSLAAVDEKSRARLFAAASHFFDCIASEPLVFDSVSIYEETSLGAAFGLLHRAVFATQGSIASSSKRVELSSIGKASGAI